MKHRVPQTDDAPVIRMVIDIFRQMIESEMEQLVFNEDRMGYSIHYVKGGETKPFMKPHSGIFYAVIRRLKIMAEIDLDVPIREETTREIVLDSNEPHRRRTFSVTFFLSSRVLELNLLPAAEHKP
jgi:hypothetical protein